MDALLTQTLRWQVHHLWFNSKGFPFLFTFYVLTLKISGFRFFSIQWIHIISWLTTYTFYIHMYVTIWNYCSGAIQAYQSWRWQFRCKTVLIRKVMNFTEKDSCSLVLRGRDSSDFTGLETLKFKNPPFQHILMGISILKKKYLSY